MKSKRSAGEGSITQLKSGTWRGQIMDGYNEDGKRKIVSFTAPTKAEVIRKIREYQTQKESNVHIDRSITFGEWGEKWYADYKGQVQDSTYCNYRYTLNILNRYLEEKKLADILPMHINELIILVTKKLKK